MIAHVGLAGYTADYQVAPTLSGNTDKALDATETRATIFSFRSASAGLNNEYRAQIAGTQVMGGYSYGDASPTTSKVHNTAGALEGILAYNNFKVQGEYSSAFYDAKSAGKLTDPHDQIKADVETGYLEAMFMLTGEKYADAYKKGAFGTIKPKSEFDFEKGSGLGAWEIGVRYDFFDVTGTEHNGTGKSRFQGGVAGGTGTTYADGNTCKYVASQPSCNGNGGGNTTTLGIKWILNPNMMVKANWAHTKFDNAFKPIDMSQGNSQKFIDSEDLLMIRGQYAF
jgi:phosphate-selective porin OprO/OprP